METIEQPALFPGIAPKTRSPKGKQLGMFGEWVPVGELLHEWHLLKRQYDITPTPAIDNRMVELSRQADAAGIDLD